jgi:hypothetical protein
MPSLCPRLAPNALTHYRPLMSNRRASSGSLEATYEDLEHTEHLLGKVYPPWRPLARPATTPP